MNIPDSLQDADRNGAIVSTYEYGNESGIAVEFGTEDVSIDIVDGAAIVVAGDRQFEFELPPDATDVSVNNGILTIRD